MGAASELRGAAHLLSRGYEVFRSVSPHAGADLVAIKGGEVLRVEVKSIGRPRQPGHCPPFGWPVNDDWDLLLIVGPDVVFEFAAGATRAQAAQAIRAHFGLEPTPAQLTHAQRVAELVAGGGEWTARTVALALGITAVAARSALVACADAGTAERIRTGLYRAN